MIQVQQPPLTDLKNARSDVVKAQWDFWKTIALIATEGGVQTAKLKHRGKIKVIGVEVRSTGRRGGGRSLI